MKKMMMDPFLCTRCAKLKNTELHANMTQLVTRDECPDCLAVKQACLDIIAISCVIDFLCVNCCSMWKGPVLHGSELSWVCHAMHGQCKQCQKTKFCSSLHYRLIIELALVTLL